MIKRKYFLSFYHLVQPLGKFSFSPFSLEHALSILEDGKVGKYLVKFSEI